MARLRPRAAEIAALRALGLSLGQVARVLGGDPQGLEPALAAHQATLEGRVRQLADAVEKVRQLRCDLAGGKTPGAGELARLLQPGPDLSVAFDLPWPWGGERFELRNIRALNYIIGPLGSGKTRLAKRLAEALPDAAFLGLERLAGAGAAARARLEEARRKALLTLGDVAKGIDTCLNSCLQVAPGAYRTRQGSPEALGPSPKARG